MSRLTSKRSNCPTRPYHLWDAKAGQRIASKFFSDPQRAHWGALKEMRWAHIGVTLEVLDVVQGRQLGSYTRKVNSIEFTGR